jgi:hypothetical protein
MTFEANAYASSDDSDTDIGEIGPWIIIETSLDVAKQKYKVRNLKKSEVKDSDSFLHLQRDLCSSVPSVRK